MSAPHYLSARRYHGHDECVCCDAQGHVRAALPLPARGHSFALDSARRRAVVFGRQPGFFAYVFSLDSAGAGAGAFTLPPEPLRLPADHHFYGHGVFAPDGNTLYATENDYVHARGVIGVYDATPGHEGVRIGEFDSGGTGPHDLVLLPDGHTLCVANGGAETHPDFGKTVLNAATMAPALTYLDRHTGRVLHAHTLEHTLPDIWRALSLRHLALDATGNVWVACQYFNASGARPALLWRHAWRDAQKQGLQPAPCPPDVLRTLGNYAGSVAVNRRGDVVAVSSPVGGQVVFWEISQATDDVRWLTALPLPDVCGIAPWGDDGFLLSSGHGDWVHTVPRTGGNSGASGNSGNSGDFMSRTLPDAPAWDNHLFQIQADTNPRREKTRTPETPHG